MSAEPLSGIVNLDKPPGVSSARVVARVKKLLWPGTKIGHAGTLDPFATGVLLLLIGRATRLCERLMDQPKEYEAMVRLGATTATDDPESSELPTAGAAPIERAVLEAALGQFVGEIRQRPPTFSALKVGGRRAYELARRGQNLDLPARAVRVYEIELIDYNWPDVRLRVECGRGTYIRALARDLGEAVGQGGYLAALRRTRVGEFSIRNAVTLEQLDAEGVAAHLLSPGSLP